MAHAADIFGVAPRQAVIGQLEHAAAGIQEIQVQDQGDIVYAWGAIDVNSAFMAYLRSSCGN